MHSEEASDDFERNDKVYEDDIGIRPNTGREEGGRR